jgi:hypothetical protein
MDVKAWKIMPSKGSTDGTDGTILKNGGLLPVIAIPDIVSISGRNHDSMSVEHSALIGNRLFMLKRQFSKVSLRNACPTKNNDRFRISLFSWTIPVSKFVRT